MSKKSFTRPSFGFVYLVLSFLVIGIIFAGAIFPPIYTNRIYLSNKEVYFGNVKKILKNSHNNPLIKDYLKKKPILYLNRNKDGWSIKKQGGVIIKSSSANEKMILLSTKLPPATVKLSLNDQEQKISLTNLKSVHVKLALKQGYNKIYIEIDKIFVSDKDFENYVKYNIEQHLGTNNTCLIEMLTNLSMTALKLYFPKRLKKVRKLFLGKTKLGVNFKILN